MAFDSFIKIGDIKGETNDSKHKDEIEVLSFSWGANQSTSMSAGAGGGGGKVQVQNFNFVKKIDKASPVLFQSCCTGDHIKQADFVVRKAGGTQLEYLKVKFTDVMIASIRPGGNANGSDDIPHEEVSLSFTKVEVDYQPQGQDGKPLGGPVHGGWDMKANTKA